tara:strand:+ start:637 stop:1416 length:780 start_codon:yes stop_codon:yes gene_type:complete
MSRRLHLTFSCEGDTLAATLDTAPLTTGLLLVSGGNEIRSGAFRGQARLAQTIAKRGFPVFRYDRRGIGDSEGENLGFTQSEPDIRAAIEAFRAIAPQVNRVIALGNCDGASALMLASGAGCDGLVLSNPWTIEDDADDSPPPQAIRARYAEKLRNPREVARLLRGGVNMRKLVGGLAKAARPAPAPSNLATKMRAGLEKFDGPVTILLASADRTAQAFQGAWPVDDVRVACCEGASHAFVEPHAKEWLEERLVEALRA